MNQGVYFGQLVIGPAGSGKVHPTYQVDLQQRDAVDGEHPQAKYHNLQPRSGRVAQLLPLRCR